MTEKWNEVFSNEDLTKKVIALSPEEAQKILAENGYTFTIEDVLAQGKEINALIENYRSGEISEESLADVSGGGHGGYFWIGVITGVTIAACGW